MERIFRAALILSLAGVFTTCGYNVVEEDQKLFYPAETAQVPNLAKSILETRTASEIAFGSDSPEEFKTWADLLRAKCTTKWIKPTANGPKPGQPVEITSELTTDGEACPSRLAFSLYSKFEPISGSGGAKVTWAYHLKDVPEKSILEELSDIQAIEWTATTTTSRDSDAETDRSQTAVNMTGRIVSKELGEVPIEAAGRILTTVPKGSAKQYMSGMVVFRYRFKEGIVDFRGIPSLENQKLVWTYFLNGEDANTTLHSGMIRLLQLTLASIE